MSDAESVARKIMKPILDCLPFEEDDMTLDIVVALQNARAEGMREAARIVKENADMPFYGSPVTRERRIAFKHTENAILAEAIDAERATIEQREAEKTDGMA